MKGLMDLVDFDIEDEKTYPKREGTYLVVSEFGKLNVAFWTEVEKVSNSSQFGVRKNPRWLCDIDCPNIKKYCKTPLAELNWTTGENNGREN